jgi:ATP-dependent DNA helicase 2 subunit 2
MFLWQQAAAVALSAVINALYETNMVAIARRVYNAASSPRVGCLIPHIKAEYEVRIIQCLIVNKIEIIQAY